MDSFEDLNSFSFLNADSSMQEEFIKQLKFIDNSAASQQLECHDFDAAVMTPLITASQPTPSDIEPLSPSPSASPCCSSSLANEDQAVCIQDGSPRSWKLVHLSGLLLANKANSLKDLNYFTDNIHIEVRTRSDISDPHVPERLYSSLKYEMRHSVKRELLLDSTNVLMCKVEVVDPQDHHEEILKTNGQKLIKGIQEVTAMSKNVSGGALECKMKIQFTDVSYHHEKKYFGFRVSFIDPLIHVSEPVIVLVSAPFQVFARRPTTRIKKESVKKSKQSKTALTANEALVPVAVPLKRKEAPVTLPSAPSKKVKSGGGLLLDEKPITPREEKKINLKRSANLQDFLQCLDLLVAFKNSLTNDEQNVALDAVQRRLLQMAAASSTPSSSHLTKLGKKLQQQQQPLVEHDSINSFFSDI